MAVQRPNVVVYQEYTSLTVTPDIPDLAVMIVGECVQILDYLDDKDDCYTDEEYGTLNENNPPTTTTAVVLSDPPNVEPGANLIAASVSVYFDEARAIVTEAQSPTLNNGVYALGDNLFEGHHGLTGGVHMAYQEVEAGDILIAGATGTDDVVMTVKEVIYTLDEWGDTLDFLTNGVQAGDIVTLSSDTVATPRDGTYTITRVRDEHTLEFTGLDWVGHTPAVVGVNTVTITVVSGSSGVVLIAPVAKAIADYSDIRMTEDFTAASPTTCAWRIERDLVDVELAASDYTISDNEITVHAAITTDITTTLTAKEVTYGKIYVEYCANRTDLQEETTLSNYSEIITTLGKYDARNPLCVGAVTALANTTTSIKIFGVTDDTLTAYLDFIDKISTKREIYAIVPLTTSSSIMASLASMCETLADPNYVLTAGIKQKFRVILGNVSLQTSKEIVTAKSGGGTLQVDPTPTALKRLTFTPGMGGTPIPMTFVTWGVIPGDHVTITDNSVVSVYHVAHVNSETAIEVDEVSAGHGLTAGDTVVITTAAGGAKHSETLGAGATITVAAAACDKYYLVFEAANANFITSGVIPGDYLEIPQALTTNVWTGAVDTWVIDEVLSNNRVRIINNGNDTSALANELPHLYRRDNCVAIVNGTIYYKVVRDMDKAQQVTTMIAVASSFANKRLVLCYPDSVDVTDLVDGSIVRTDPAVPEPAAAQPGYYLACAVGGQTAGNPSQMGFTNKGIAGIDRVYNSSDYFSEEQITDLSNGGVYVFMQENPSSLPYSIHAITTDTTALEFSEYMAVKNFDFIAWTFLDTLLPFIGPWNVNEETIEFIRQAIYATGGTLKSRYVSKIGAPLTDFSITSVAESDLSTDRIEAYVDIDMPMVLNTIGLHLVA